MALRGLAGKTAVVTGAAGGIGSAIVARLLAEGCNIAAVDLDEAAILQACGNADPARFQAIAGDVTTEEGARAYVDAAVRRFGGVDLFANNAGVFDSGRIVDMPAAAFDRVISVNLRGVFLGLQAALRQMIAQGRGGAIVNTASTGAFGSAVACGAYNASKAAVVSLTRTAAHENGAHGVRVNAVCPGFTNTPMLAVAVQSGDPDERAAHHPLGRVGRPSEIADLVAYLLSEEASFQTGSICVADGGSMVS